MGWGVNDERNNEPGDAVSPIDGIRRTFDLAVGELRRDVELAVDRVKRKIKWTATQQDAIVGLYKTLICEAVDAVPSSTFLSGTVDIVDYMLNLAILYPRVTTQAYESEWDVWYQKVDLFVPLRFILTGEAWDVDVYDRQWARADGKVGVIDAHAQMSDDSDGHVRPFHPVAIERGVLFDCLAKMGISLPLWRTKKSHFRPSDEKSMKNVDKDAVNTTIGIVANEKVALSPLGRNVWSPNEDFGSPSKHSGTHFQSNFQINVAQIEY
jgi:hypothetical protein